MSKLDVAKKILNPLVGLSASFVVSSIIRNNVTPTSTIRKIETEVGAFVIGYMVADAATKYAEVKVEEIATWYNVNIKPKLYK
jgi:hypothetical protein